MSAESEHSAARARLAAARHHVVVTNAAVTAAVEDGLRTLITAFRAAAFLETDPARIKALAESADGLEDMTEHINKLTAKAWDAVLARPFCLVPAEQEAP